MREALRAISGAGGVPGLSSGAGETGRADGEPVLPSNFSHSPSSAATATFSPARLFLIPSMSMSSPSGDDVGAAARGREVVRGGGDGGLPRVKSAADAGNRNDGKLGKGTEGGGPDGAMARA